MELQKRDCPIKFRLVPYGAGWTDVYADFGDGEKHFIISNIMGDGFDTLLQVLYMLNPNNQDGEEDYSHVEYEEGICEFINNKYVVTEVLDVGVHKNPPYVSRPIPWRASFTWDEEGACSNWSFERAPNEDESFDLKVKIEVCRDEIDILEYTVKYEDLCYAVANAYTKMLKKHGFWGYHSATYNEDVNVRQLLFIKSIALHNYEARELTFYEEKGKGETCDFSKEIELLLFDM